MTRSARSQLASRRQHGQAMTEFVIWAFVLLCMISGILWFGKAYDLKLQCHFASRYLAWSHAQQPETDFEDDLILQRVQVYYPMTENSPDFNQLDPAASTFDPDSLNPGGPSGDGFNVFSLMNGMFNMASNTQGWQVTASYAPGGILDETLPDGTNVRSQHFVSGGAWHKKQISGDIIIMGVKTGLFIWSAAVLNS